MAFQLWDDLEDEFELYGIRSNKISETKFVYNLNRELNLSFTRQPDLDVTFSKETFCYSLYASYDSILDAELLLFKNNSHINKDNSVLAGGLFDSYETTRHLLRKHKLFDYLLKIPLKSDSVKWNALSLVSATHVQLIQLIDNITKTEKKSLII